MALKSRGNGLIWLEETKAEVIESTPTPRVSTTI